MSIDYAQTGTLNDKTYSDLLDVTFDELKATADKAHLQGSQFFAKRMANRLEYKHAQTGSNLDLPVESDDEDALPYTQPSPHYTKTFNPVNYRSAVKITRTLMETDQYGVAKDKLAGLFKASQRQDEYQMADVFNTSFSALGADGVALFSDSHTHPDALAGTWDNLNTASDITMDSYFNMRLNMRNRTSEKGDICPLQLDTLVCVADKERRAKEVIRSAKVADGDLNNENQFMNECKIVVWDWLTSQTAWFGLDSSASDNEKGLFHIERVAPNIIDASSDPSVGVDVIWARRLRKANDFGATIMYAWDGNAGA